MAMQVLRRLLSNIDKVHACYILSDDECHDTLLKKLFFPINKESLERFIVIGVQSRPVYERGEGV